ncbi:MAG TPA: 50S ribosomal protein L10 [Ktedonobacteraceae bacterium]|jgi:large subunit ribosomal protein L10
MPTQAKAQKITELQEKLQRSTLTILVQTQGLSVKDMEELRRKLRAANVELQIAKNTLLRIATERNEWKDLDTSIFNGQTTVAFSYEDEIAAAKAIADYINTSKKAVVLKSGILDGRNLSAAQVDTIAKIKGGKDQPKAEVVGVLQGPMSTTYSLLTAPLRDLCYILQARADQLNSGTEAAAE